MTLAEVFFLRASLADMNEVKGYFHWLYKPEEGEGGVSYSTTPKRPTEWLTEDSPELADGKSYLRFLSTKRGYRNNTFKVKMR